MGTPSGNELGIALAVIASVSGALGNLLFRLSWKAEQWGRSIRFAGLVTVVAADPARILSFGFGESRVVAPFSSLSLVWLILLANPIAGDKPTRVEVAGALVIASGVALIAAFGADGASDDDDDGDTDEFGVSGGDDDDKLHAVIDEFNANARRPAFVLYLLLQGAFLLAAGATVATSPPERLPVKVCWGALGGVLQGNVYFLKAASTLAVIDFGGACRIATFWVWTVLFIVIAATGLAVNALAMRFYKATFCVCSFVGWYNVSAAAASASFFGASSLGDDPLGLALYLGGLGFIVGGVVMLIVVSIDEALKDDDDDGGGGGGDKPRDRGSGAAGLDDSSSDGGEAYWRDERRPSSITEYVADALPANILTGPSPNRHSSRHSLRNSRNSRASRSAREDAAAAAAVAVAAGAGGDFYAALDSGPRERRDEHQQQQSGGAFNEALVGRGDTSRGHEVKNALLAGEGDDNDDEPEPEPERRSCALQ